MERASSAEPMAGTPIRWDVHLLGCPPSRTSIHWDAHPPGCPPVGMPIRPFLCYPPPCCTSGVLRVSAGGLSRPKCHPWGVTAPSREFGREETELQPICGADVKPVHSFPSSGKSQPEVSSLALEEETESRFALCMIIPQASSSRSDKPFQN